MVAKREYVKPELLVEDFVVSDYFANCGLSFQFGPAGQCANPGNIDPNLWQQWAGWGIAFIEGSCEGETMTEEDFNEQTKLCYFTLDGTTTIGS